MDQIKPPRKSDERPAVYVIRHAVTGMRYIGSSKTPLNRVYAHIWHLNKGSHTNHLFQKAWDKCNDFYLSTYVTLSIQEARTLERAMIGDKAIFDKLLNIVGAHTSDKIAARRLAVKPLLLERIAKQCRKVIAAGTEYESVRFCERAIGLSQRTIVRRIESNKSEYDDWKYA